MKDYKKYFTISAPPVDVWHALTNPITIQLWTGEPAIMSTEPGSEFSLWDGSISGTNIAFEENKKIIQEWDFGDQADPSTVTLILHARGEGTSIELIHTNIPDEDYQDMIDGWNSSYFGALQEFYRE